MIEDGRLEYSRLFVDDKDRERFLERLAERIEEYGVRLYMFVLMANHFLMRHSGLSQREVAEKLQIGSGAAVCNQLKRLPAKLSADRHLRKQYEQAEDRLRTLKTEMHKKKPTKCIVKG
jgi:hypothetical protein